MSASIVDCKGSGDELTVKNLANLFREIGETKKAYKTNQENVVKAFVDYAIKQAGFRFWKTMMLSSSPYLHTAQWASPPQMVRRSAPSRCLRTKSKAPRALWKRESMPQ